MSVSSVNKEKFNDYEGFVKKFKPKKTTDDCYTPPAVYEVIMEWLRENADIEGREIVRPFYPGGDYERFDYPPGCVVVDNPPFSIFSKIVRFYLSKGVRFFLFAPSLTLFSCFFKEITYLATFANITYENGAVIPTSFVSNLPDFEEYAVLNTPGMRNAIDLANKETALAKKMTFTSYKHHPNMISSALLQKISAKDVPLAFYKEEILRPIKKERTAENVKKSVYGGGITPVRPRRRPTGSRQDCHSSLPVRGRPTGIG